MILALASPFNFKIFSGIGLRTGKDRAGLVMLVYFLIQLLRCVATYSNIMSIKCVVSAGSPK